MEIKKGQYGRIGNDIFKCDQIERRNYSVAFDKKKGRGYPFGDIEKVADTPQELVQVGDLVRDSKFIGIYEIETDAVLDLYKYIDGFTTITEIYTKNSKGGYDLQYEVEQ